MRELRAYSLCPTTNIFEKIICGHVMIPRWGQGSPLCPPNKTNSKDNKTLESLPHFLFNVRGLRGRGLCQMTHLFKRSYFLVHFCSLLGILYCPRSLSSGLFFKLIKGLNPCYNHILSWAGFRLYGCHNDWFKCPKNDFLMCRAEFTLFEPPWTRPNMSHPVLCFWKNVWACQPAK